MYCATDGGGSATVCPVIHTCDITPVAATNCPTTISTYRIALNIATNRPPRRNWTTLPAAIGRA